MLWHQAGKANGCFWQVNRLMKRLRKPSSPENWKEIFKYNKRKFERKNLKNTYPIIKFCAFWLRYKSNNNHDILPYILFLARIYYRDFQKPQRKSYTKSITAWVNNKLA
jgi:hypothetical protein